MWLVLRIGLGLLLLALLGALAWIGPFAWRVERHPAEPVRGFHSDFYLYVPSLRGRGGEGEAPATILVQPNNSGRISDDPEVHRRDAWWMCFERHRIARELGVVLLVPTFTRPATDWRLYTHALDRDCLTTDRTDLKRLDLQLLAMIDRAREKLAARGVAVEERVLIQGFSASGMFASRFTALHPRRVRAAAIGSPGGWPLVPVDFAPGSTQDDALPLQYPAGIADFAELTGDPFDLAAFRGVPQLFVQGSADDNDSLDFGDGWDAEPAAAIQARFGDTPLARWDAAKDLFSLAGCNARFELVPGVDHDRRALQPLSTRFLAEQLREEN